MTARRTLTWLSVLLLAWLLVLPSAEAQRRRRRRGAGRGVAVEVVDVSGGRAYVSPGESAGVVRGSEVTLGRETYVVVASSSNWAAIDLPEGQSVEVGEDGRATTSVEEGEVEGPRRLDPPRPLTAFAGAWPDAELPASQQTPTPVPLGRTRGERRVDLTASTGMAAIIPFRDADVLFRGDLRVRGRVAPFDGVPFWVTGDVSGQLWLAEDLGERSFGNSRPPLRVRELTVAWGQPHEIGDLYAAVGRLRNVAMQLGALDGISVRSPALEGFTVGAFGGFVPDPTLGVPDFDTQRFGLELAYRNLRSDLRPAIGVVAHGSLFRGTIDERRLNVVAQLFPDIGRLGAHAELSLHDAVNPWAVSEVELSAAGIDGGIRIDAVDIGARFDMRRPERSRWLANFLPASWLCIALPQAPDVTTPEPCSGIDDARLSGSADLGVRIDQWALRAGGNVIHYVADATLGQVGGYASVRAAPLFETLRGDLFVSASTGAVYDTMAARLSLGWSIVPDVLDIAAHYRVGYGLYRADLSGWVEHMAGGSIVLTPMPELSITLAGDGLTGRDLDVLMLQLQAVFRPSF
jgi:hypothetical protein